MKEWLSDVRVLAVLVAVGAFVLTYAGHRTFMTLKDTLLRATGRGGSRGPGTPASAAAGSGVQDAPPEPASSMKDAKAERAPPGGDAFGVANAASAGHAPARRAPAAATRGASTPAGRAAAGLIAKAHPPQENTFRTLKSEPVEHAEESSEDDPQLISETREWERAVREVMSEESILAEHRESLSDKRTLKSLLGNIRDRELLAARGHRIGRDLHATNYADLGDKLVEKNVCEEAHFRHAPEGAIDARLIGTAMAREAPVIGIAACFIETGLIAGALQNMENTRFKVREVRCVVKGDPFCEFRAERQADEEKRPSLYDETDASTTGGSA